MSVERMSQILLQFILILTSQGGTFACLIILPICVLNVLPFLSRLFELSETHKRILLMTVIGIDTALTALSVTLTRHLIYSIKYDTWMHLAMIQRGVENGLFAGDPFYMNYPPPPHYSIVDVLYIYASKITGIAPHLLWGNSSFLVAALIFLACVWWHRELFDKLQLGWLAGLLFLLSISSQWHYAIYPRNFALIPFFACLLFYFRSAKRIRYVVHCGMSFGLCIMSHLFTAVVCFAFVIAYFLLACAIDAIHRKQRCWASDFKRLAFIPMGCIVASPWVFVFLKEAVTHTETSVSQYSQPSWHVDAAMLGRTFTIYAPKRMLEVFPDPVWILAGIGFLICLYYVIRGNYKPGHVFLISSAIVPVLVLLTPLYSPIVRICGEWMPTRFVTVMSVPALAALTCGMAVELFSEIGRNHYRRGLIISSVGVLLAFTFMMAVISPAAIQQKQLYDSQDEVLTPLLTWDSDFSSLKGMLKDRVVLTDPMTSYFLTYYTGAYVVAITRGHGSPYINDEARNADVSAMFDPNTSRTKRCEMLDKYHVEYVMLNMRPGSSDAASRYDWIGSRYGDSCKAIFDQQEAFRLVYDVNGVVVYRYQPIFPGFVSQVNVSDIYWSRINKGSGRC